MSYSADMAIIGPGKVGTTLAVLAARAGLRVAVGGRRAEITLDAAGLAGPRAAAMDIDRAALCAPLVLLTVSDGAISSVCGDLAGRGAFRDGTVVAHCSGLLGSDALAAAGKAGCRVGSMHPLASFPSVEAALAAFGRAWCFVEGDEAAVAALEALARTLGAARCVRLEAGRKPLYHAAAAMACNHLCALMDAAEALAAAAGVPSEQALPALEGLVRGTVDNVFALGPAAALTGPIARGDAQAVRMHLAALAGQEPALADLYRGLGRWTVRLALKKGSVTPVQAAQLEAALTDKPTPSWPGGNFQVPDTLT